MLYKQMQVQGDYEVTVWVFGQQPL